MTPRINYTKKDILKDDSLYKKIWDNNPSTLKYSEKEIRDMVYNCNRYIGKIVASTRDGVAMPLYMGVLFAGTYGKREDTIDVSTSNAIGKEVVYPNHDTDGYGANIYYITEVTKTRFALGKFWGFEADYVMDDELSKHYKESWKRYAHVPDSRRAWKLFSKNKLKEYAQKKGMEAIEMYNEFDFDNID